MQLLGLIATIFLVLSLISVQVIWGVDYFKTFSRQVAKQRSSIIYYFVVFAIFLSLFSIFMFGWFVPHFQLPVLFSVVFALGVAAQLACVLVPETSGKQAQIHIAAATIMSACALVQTVLIVWLIKLSSWLMVVGLFSITIMLLAWLIYILKLRAVKYELAIQSVYFACYLLTLMLVTYWA